jgi:hypothetical protein
MSQLRSFDPLRACSILFATTCFVGCLQNPASLGGDLAQVTPDGGGKESGADPGAPAEGGSSWEDASDMPGDSGVPIPLDSALACLPGPGFSCGLCCLNAFSPDSGLLDSCLKQCLGEAPIDAGSAPIDVAVLDASPGSCPDRSQELRVFLYHPLDSKPIGCFDFDNSILVGCSQPSDLTELVPTDWDKTRCVRKNGDLYITTGSLLKADGWEDCTPIEQTIVAVPEACPRDCPAGFENAPRYDEAHGCWRQGQPLGCYELNNPEIATTGRCVRRKIDGALFLSGDPRKLTEWDDCTPQQAGLAEMAPFCP